MKFNFENGAEARVDTRLEPHDGIFFFPSQFQTREIAPQNLEARLPECFRQSIKEGLELQFEKLVARNNLEKAWCCLRRKKIMPGSDGVSVGVFAARAEHQLAELERELRGGCYHPGLLLRWELERDGHRARHVFMPTLRDRVAQLAALDTLTPTVCADRSPVAHAYLSGRSQKTAVRAARSYLATGHRWVAQLDIENFFESVNRLRLSKILRERYGTGRVSELLLSWAEGSAWDRAQGLVATRGLPAGLPISPFLSHLYLDGFDRKLEAYPAVRYGDDLLVFATNLEEAHHRASQVQEWLKQLGLEVNVSKTSISSVVEGFRFLGAEFNESSTDPESDSVQVQNTGSLARTNKSQRRRPSRRVLYVREPKAVVRRQGRKFVVSKEGSEIFAVSAQKLSQLVLLGQARITLPALHQACYQSVPVHLVTGSGRYRGVVESSAGANIDLERYQWARSFESEFCLGVARQIVGRKIRSQVDVLRGLLARQEPAQEVFAQLRGMMERAERVQSLPELLGCEGHAAAVYFGALGQCFPAEFVFPGRKSHPSLDPINGLLSFGYGLLAQNMFTAIRVVGLNPYLGFYHRSRGEFAALAYDLMEEFRAPVVDCFVVSLLRSEAVRPSDFDRSPTGCWLRSEVRREFLRKFEEKLQLNEIVFGCDARGWRFAFERHVRAFADLLCGKRKQFE